MVEDNQEITMKCGFEGLDNDMKVNFIEVSDITKPEKIFLMNGKKSNSGWTFSDTSLACASFDDYKNIKNGEDFIFAPKFLIISELDLKEANLVDLRNIRFS